jgi:hypothetical protein
MSSRPMVPVWLVLMLLGSPVMVAAQTGGPNAVLHEVTETMKLLGSKPKQGESTSRQATAALMGEVQLGSALCPTALLLRYPGLTSCGIAAYASSNVLLSTGTGSVSGGFSVIVQGDNVVDGPELVIARGSLGGQIDLSPAMFRRTPVGLLQGQWSAIGAEGGPLQGRKLGGTLTGTFRLPFVFGLPLGCLDDGDPTDCLYISRPSYLGDDGVPFELGPEHYSLKVPTVKLDLQFTGSSL